MSSFFLATTARTVLLFPTAPAASRINVVSDAMTTVFVHGVPESADVWSPLISSLAQRGVDGDVVLLSPPGFGTPAPEWEPTAPNYVTWLVNELDQLDGPIDIVGHDWGAGHVYGMLAERPDLVRSWAADVAGIFHPDYVWHDMAQAWQQPGVGEEVIQGMVGQPVADRRQLFEGLGLPSDVAEPMAAALNEDMGRSILALYRSAVHPYGGDVGAVLASRSLPRGLVIDADEDPYVASDLSNDVARKVGAKVLSLEGQGHWWMISAPDEAADGLIGFWSAAA